ncbi:hypothetical protein QUF90_06820 [Desulfococcaceae bacterium HSG9]|nr:hypothetical protein [Desulfococcaceae bacterium HSG9]
MGLTLGPLVMPLSGRNIHRKQRFGNHKQICDMRKGNGAFKLKARESAVVFTNEWIKIDRRITGIILSRVTNYSKGLHVEPSYIDSLWEGVLKLHIINFSDRAIKIRLGEEIARLFFFQIDPDSSDANTIIDTCHHYGNNWFKILTDEIDPFGSSRASQSWFQELLAKFRTKWKLLLLIFSLPGILGLLWGSLQFYVELNKQTSNLAIITQKIKKNEDAAKTISQNIASMRGKVTDSGLTHVTIDTNQSTAIKEIVLNKHVVLNVGYVLVQADGNIQGVKVKGAIAKGTKGNLLTITVELDKPSSQKQSIPVKWAVIP